jgi:CHASE2 domain-containing sensor protein
MQNTRLSTLFDTLFGQLTLWLRNPWRRTSLIIIGLLAGNYFANAIALIAGQRAALDVIFAAIVVFLSEIVSWITYNRRIGGSGSRPFLVELLNAFKIGTAYGFAVEAFKLGS